MMRTIQLTPNSTLTYEVGGRYDLECRKAEAARSKIEQEERVDDDLRAWLRSHDPSDPEYSDIFKDVYGVRP